jgi:hypothetical protein
MACTPLQAATVQGHFRIALFLVQKGGDVSIPAHSGNTALHFACQKSYVGLASFLIESGASLSALNDAGEAPIDVAEEGMKELLFEDTSNTPSVGNASAVPAGDPSTWPSGGAPKNALSFNEEAQVIVIENTAMLGDIGDAARHKAGPGPHVFGKAFFDNFTSPEWKTRVAAIKALTKELENVDGDPALLYNSACEVRLLRPSSNCGKAARC